MMTTLKKNINPTLKHFLSIQINLKLYIDFNVARGFSLFMKSISTSSSPKKMLSKLKKSQIKHFTRGKDR